MTEKQIIETLATKVMGWELGRHAGELFWFEKGLLKTKEKDWNPLQNIADAWQVVEKIGTGMTVQEAICNAALKVVTLTKR